VKRRHADARMLNGGHFYIACSFAVDPAEKRWLTWGINIDWTAGEWLVQASAEEEEDHAGSMLWESSSFRPTTIGEFASSLKQAQEALESSLEVPRIAAIFETWSQNA